MRGAVVTTSGTAAIMVRPLSERSLEVARPYEREDRDQAPGPRLLGGAKAGRRPTAPHGAHGDARGGPLAERRDGVSRRLPGGARWHRPLRAPGAAGRRQLPAPLPRGGGAWPPSRHLRSRGHRLGGAGDPRLRGRAVPGRPARPRLGGDVHPPQGLRRRPLPVLHRRGPPAPARDPQVASGCAMPPLVQPDEGELKLNGLRFHYFEWRGGGQRPLVLMHGLRDYAYYWQGCAHRPLGELPRSLVAPRG